MVTTKTEQTLGTAFWVLLCGSLILTISMGVRHTGGLFLPPMTTEHGWSRAGFGMAIAIQNLIWGLGQPIAGAVADRFGALRTLLVGAVLYAAGLLIMANAQTMPMFGVGAGLLVGLGLAGTTFGVVLGAIGRSVPANKRSMALGIASAGGSFGQFAVLPMGQGLIEAFGWHSALLWLMLVVACIVPLSIGLRGAPTTMAHGGLRLREAVAEAMGQPSFHLLFWGFFVCGFQTAFIMLHLPAFLVDAGFSANVGMRTLALIGLFNIFGSFLSGWLGGRWSKKGLLTFIYAARIFVILPMVLMPLTPSLLYTFGALMGLLWLGTVPLTNGLVGQIFGMGHVSMLYGIIFLGHQIGGFLGAWLGGAIVDRTGSYAIAWWLAIGLSLIAALLSWPVREAPLPRISAEAA